MSSAVFYVIPAVVALFVLLGCGVSVVLIVKRSVRNRLWRKRKTKPSSTELRMRKVPVIESTPFWVPGIIGDIIGIEIQPFADTPLPVTYSTPKPRRCKVSLEKIPKLKFSIQYHKASGVLEVQLLDTANISVESLSDDELNDDDSSVFLFANVCLTQQEETKKRLRLMSRRRRRRHKSFEIEMNYETLQLQTLQFCVMGYDVYSRQKVIGDVLLPLADLAQQGMDITKELVMWRDIQTCQPRWESLCERIGHMSNVRQQASQGAIRYGPKATGQPAERRCSAS